MVVSDGLLVRIQFLVQVQLTAIGTFRLHGLAVHPFKIIPPFFDGIDAPVANLVVELGDPLAGEGQVNGHLQEEVVYEQPLVVVRTGFHAASASRTFGVSDTVADAAFRIRLPHFVAVEHHGVTPTYRITRALPRALEALLAHVLESEINRLVVGERHVGGDNDRLEAQTDKRVENELADAAQFAKSGVEDERDVQDFTVKVGMHSG